MPDRLTDPPNALQDLGQRDPFAWLRERDVDLLICAELHANARLQSHLAECTGGAEVAFAGAWISLAEIEGESDLVVGFTSEAGLRLLLVENKIAAAFQPEQAERYQSRAARWRRAKGVKSVWTVLLAPSDYLARPGATAFDIRLSYEDMASVLREEPDRRSHFLADALEAGIAAYRRGYVPVPDAAVSGVWATIWRLASEVAPQLRMRQPDAKPRQSTWIAFTDADGFSGEDRQRVKLIFKAEHGRVDLQFARTKAADLSSLVGNELWDEMNIVQASKSASIRIRVPTIAFGEEIAAQEGALREGLLQCERLRQFFIQRQISARLRDQPPSM